MKLAFYSDILVENPIFDQEVLELIGKKSPKIGYIPSCSDRQRKYYREIKNYYQRYGISDFIYFDLDKEFDQRKIGELESCNAIHLSGGNTYYFLNLIKKRNFASILKDYAEKKKVLIGVSAGAILMTPTIAISHDKNIVGVRDLRGLNLVNFEFSPHFNRGGDEKRLKEYSKKSPNFIYACDDGGGIVIDGKKVKFYTKVRQFFNGKLIEL